jgi:hypothetical protein
MGVPALLKLRHKDIGALLVFCLLGLLVGSAISEPAWAAYAAALVCDHLFLGWLLFMGEFGARRPLPMIAIVSIHLAFVALVIVVVAARHSLPYFNLFPYPMAAFALWLLSSAVGFEKNKEERAVLRRAQSSTKAPPPQLLRDTEWTRPAASEPARPGPAIRVPQLASSSVHPQAEPAARSVQPGPAKRAPDLAKASRRAQPRTAIKVSQPAASSVHAQAEPSVSFAQPEPAMSAPELARASRQATPQPATKVSQPVTSNGHSQPEPAKSAPKPAKARGRTHAVPANGSPRPDASGDLPRTLTAASFAQPEPAMNAPEPTTASHQARPESAKNGYQPMVSGIALKLEPLVAPPQPAPEPELYRDNSIAAGLRQKHSDEAARLNPILAATPEDHEEWLRLRRVENPTHRKLGLTVREEYEQWLLARAEARSGGPPAA